MQYSEFIFFLDKNECKLSVNPCHSYATCTNLVGSHICKCKSGYQGNGINCTGKDLSLQF